MTGWDFLVFALLAAGFSVLVEVALQALGVVWRRRRHRRSGSAR